MSFSTDAANPFDILLVENDLGNSSAIQRALKQARIKNPVHSTASADEALNFLRRERVYSTARQPGLVLVSTQLPDMEATTLLAAIREETSYEKTPVVFLGEHKNVAATTSTSTDFQGTLSLPFDVQEFVTLIKSKCAFWTELQTSRPELLSPKKVPAYKPSSPPFPPDNTRWRILVVEDSLPDIVLIRKLFKRISDQIQTIVAERVADAEQELLRGKFDAVVSDLSLPDCQGVETVQRLHKAGGNTPLIVLTMTDDEKLGSELIAHGAADYLVKDQSDFSTIRRCIRYAIERTQMETHLRNAQRMESLGGLAGGVAHDFNNLLSVIGGMAQLQEISKGKDEYTTKILKAADHGSQLTRQLLAFSSGNPLTLKLVDLNQIVRDFTDMMERLLGPQIEIDLNLHQMPLPVEVDVGMVEQVVMNLAVNARDAMPSGGTLTISTEPEITSETRNFARLFFRDTGSGMPPETQARIFEPFFTTKAPHQGTGLGLSTVHGIVRQHRGSISVESREGAGTTFDVRLPLLNAELPSSHQTRPQPVIKEVKGTVLVVDDVEEVLIVTARVLEYRGFKVYQALNGREALDLWPSIADEVEVLLTDLMLPGGILGGDLSQQLQAKKPELKLIYMSGNHHHPAHSGIKFEEGVNFVAKPYEVDQLVSVLAQALDGLPARKTKSEPESSGSGSQRFHEVLEG